MSESVSVMHVSVDRNMIILLSCCTVLPTRLQELFKISRVRGLYFSQVPCSPWAKGLKKSEKEVKSDGYDSGGP